MLGSPFRPSLVAIAKQSPAGLGEVKCHLTALHILPNVEIIQQFNEMFPNIKLILIDNVKGYGKYNRNTNRKFKFINRSN